MIVTFTTLKKLNKRKKRCPTTLFYIFNFWTNGAKVIECRVIFMSENNFKLKKKNCKIGFPKSSQVKPTLIRIVLGWVTFQGIKK